MADDTLGGYAPVIPLRPPGRAERPILRLVAPLPARRRRKPVLTVLCGATAVLTLSGVGTQLARHQPTSATFARPTVPYVAPADAFKPPAPIELRPYVAPVPAGLPTRCQGGCPSYFVPST